MSYNISSDTTTSTTLYNTSNSSYTKPTSSSRFTNSMYSTNRENIAGGVSYSFSPTWVPNNNVFERGHATVEEIKPTIMNRVENVDPNRQFQKPFTFHYDKKTSTSDLYFPLYVNEVTTVNITHNKIVDCSSGQCKCLENCTSKCKKKVCFSDSDSVSSDDSECSSCGSYENEKTKSCKNKSIKDHLSYLENVRQDFQNKTQGLIKNFIGTKYRESKMIMFLCKVNTIAWLENTLKHIIDINDWYEKHLSNSIDNIDQQNFKKYMDTISKNSLCGNIEKVFQQILELTHILNASKENFPTLNEFTSNYVADIAWLFSKKIEELNYIESKLEKIQSELNNLENKIYEIVRDKSESTLFKDQIS